MNELVRRQVAVLLAQVQLLAALLDAEAVPEPEPGEPACARCEGALREAVVDGEAGLICGECNTPATAEGG